MDGQVRLQLRGRLREAAGAGGGRGHREGAAGGDGFLREVRVPRRRRPRHGPELLLRLQGPLPVRHRAPGVPGQGDHEVPGDTLRDRQALLQGGVPVRGERGHRGVRHLHARLRLLLRLSERPPRRGVQAVLPGHGAAVGRGDAQGQGGGRGRQGRPPPRFI